MTEDVLHDIHETKREFLADLKKYIEQEIKDQLKAIREQSKKEYYEMSYL